MPTEMLINVSEGEECRIALVEDGRLEELYIERASATSHVGNIYKGRVTNVEPSIQAAFIDFGLGRNGFLHISDLMPTYFGKRGEDVQETVGRKLARRDRPPIQRCLRRGDEIIVQIIKEGIGTKGPTLSTYVSIPGRILVMMPGMSKNGVSRKIEDEEERRRLRQILDALRPPTDCGFIIRTAGVGKTKADIQRDLNYLTRLWTTIKKTRDSAPAPVELYTEGDLVTRTVRDVFTSDIDRIIVDSEPVARKISEFLKIALPRTKDRVELYQQAVPLFHKYRIEPEIERMYSRHVPLPSGGSLVIDSTEAIVAIDVNSGRFREHADAETTAFKTDLEAADEIPRQLRLRDLGGVIICDFIDLRFERHRRELEKRLHDNLKKDRAKSKVLRMSQFGIIEMTRQRMRPSLKRSIYSDCPHCKGSGLVKTPESMGLDVMRKLAIAAADLKVQRLELAVCPDVACVLANRKRKQLCDLEERTGKPITVRAEPTLGMDELRLELFDSRDGLVFLEDLGMTAQPAGPPPHGQRPPRPPRGRPELPPRERPPREERPELVDEGRAETMEMDRAEDEVEQREQTQEEEPTSLQQAAPVGPDLRDEAAQPPADQPAQAPAATPQQAHAPLGSQLPQRRRRRRGGRGRGRNRGDGMPSPAGDRPWAQPQPADQAPGDEELPTTPYDSPEGEGAEEFESLDALLAPQAHPAQGEPDGAPRPKRRRRGRRGGRRHRRKNAQALGPAGAATPASPPAGPVAPAGPVVRTGSTDRHLIHDEPVEPPPLPRPRSLRDLDNIPGDLD